MCTGYTEPDWRTRPVSLFRKSAAARDAYRLYWAGELPQSRAEAKRRRFLHYVGRPCKSGHNGGRGAIRYVSTSSCVDCEHERNARHVYADDKASKAITLDRALREKPEPDYWDSLMD